MRRSSAAQVLQAAVQPRQELAPVHVIDPNGIYFTDQAQKILRLKSSTIRREVREGRLRIAKRAGRYYLLGAWLLEWLRGGEVKRRQPLGTAVNHEGSNGDCRCQ